MHCYKCGKKYESNAVYCASCGSELIDRSVPTTQTGDRNKGAISELFFVIFSIVSLIILLSSTIMALNMTVSSCDRSMFGICGSDFEILGRWWLGFLFVILTVIFFVVLSSRRGKTTKVHGALLIIVMITVAGTCANNIYQSEDEIENYSQNVEVARQQDCEQQLRYAHDNLNYEPDNLNYIMNLAEIQQSQCRDFESAHENYEKILSLYESKQETTEAEKRSYNRALNGLLLILETLHRQELEEKCPTPEIFSEFHQEAHQSCQDSVWKDHQNNREKYQSKFRVRARAVEVD